MPSSSTATVVEDLGDSKSVRAQPHAYMGARLDVSGAARRERLERCSYGVAEEVRRGADQARSGSRGDAHGDDCCRLRILRARGDSVQRTDARSFALCEAMMSDDDGRFIEALEDPPSGLEDAAAEVLRAQGSGDGAGDAAFSDFLDWMAINCYPNAARPGAKAGDRRLAPPVGSVSDRLTLCGVGLAMPTEGSAGGAVLYGEDSASDPYSGPMLGVVWGTEDQAGDGDATPVRVRGTDGVAAPITVFQQAIIDELGTVIAWEEDGLSVGLYGRRWDPSRTDDLIALVDSLEFVNGRFRLPAGSLPEGYTQVFQGLPSALSLVFATDAEYRISYGDADGQHSLAISGFLAASDEFEAVRFLTLGLEHRVIAGRDAIVGNAWGQDGPAVVTWREDDGLVVRLVGLGIDLATATYAAEATRDLNRSEWVEFVERESECSAPEITLPSASQPQLTTVSEPLTGTTDLP